MYRDTLNYTDIGQGGARIRIDANFLSKTLAGLGSK
jgi:hypothetical protein